MAETEAGFCLGVEPVMVEPVAGVDDLYQALLQAIKRGNPVVPTPTRNNFPPDIMRKYCGMRSFAAFERSAACWSINFGPDSSSIYPWVRADSGKGGAQDRQRTTILPDDPPVEVVVRKAAELAMEGE